MSASAFLQPANLDELALAAEKDVLATLLSGADSSAHLCARRWKPSHFVTTEDRLMFIAILAVLKGKQRPTVDAVALELARRAWLLRAGGRPAVEHLVRRKPSPDRHAPWAILEHRRSLLLACLRREKAAGGLRCRPLLAPSAVVTRAVEQIRHHHSRDQQGVLSWGLRELDRVTCGIHPSAVSILLSPQAWAGHSIALNAVRKLALERNVPVGICALETSPERLLLHMACMAIGVRRRDFLNRSLNQHCLERIVHHLKLLERAPIFFVNPRENPTFSHFLSSFRHLRRAHGVRLLVLDPLHRMSGLDDLNWLTLMLDLKACAAELSMPILGLETGSPLYGLKRIVHNPKYAMLREHADCICELEWCFDIEPDLLDAYVCKNEHGGAGKVALRYARERGLIEDRDAPSDVDLLLEEVGQEERVMPDEPYRDGPAKGDADAQR